MAKDSTTTVTTPTDDELRQQALNMYNPTYQAQVNSLNQNESALSTTYNRTLADYGTYVNNMLKTTQQSAEDSLVKRGMGRSDEGTYEITKGLADVNAAAQKDYKQMQEDYLTNTQNIESQKNVLAGSLEQNVQSQIMNLKQYYEGIRQFNEEMAYKEQALKKSGGGGGGSSKTGISAVDVFNGTNSPTYRTTDGQYVVNGKPANAAQFGVASGDTAARRGTPAKKVPTVPWQVIH